MPVVTPASLERRLEKIDEEINRREAQLRNSSGSKLITCLPGADEWEKFARKTWIQTGDEKGPKVVRFRPYGFQIRAVRKIHASKNSISLKSRQQGFSELVCSYLLCRALTEPGFVAVVISKNQKDSSELAGRVKFMANSIRDEKLEWLSQNTIKLSWKGRGTIHFLPAVDSAGRGIPACSVLFLDEAAFIQGVADIYQGASPAMALLGDAGKVIVVSTPDMEVDWFGTTWCDGLPIDWYDYVAKRNWRGLERVLDAVDDEWARIPVHYSMHPVYSKDPNWAKKYKKSKKYTDTQWNSEFELKFNSTDSAIYPSALVDIGAKKKDFEECGLITHSYILAVDPNGTKSDYFVSMVIDISVRPYQVVSMYRQNYKSTPYSLSHVVKQIVEFNPDKIIVEANSMGVVIAEALQSKVGASCVSTIYMSEMNKNITTDRVLYLLEQELLTFPAGVIAQELKAFRRTEKGRREAAPGHNDDTVMCLAVAVSLIPETADVTNFLANL